MPLPMLSRRSAVVILLPLALTACGVPDLVAHGVKSYERTQDANRVAAEAPPPASSQPAPAYQAAPPAVEAEYVPASAPPRERVTAEPLR